MTTTPDPQNTSIETRGLIFDKMAEVGRDLKAVEMVNMQRYKARHIYDVYNSLQPILALHGVTLSRKMLSCDSEKITSSKGTQGVHRVVWFRYCFFAKDGSRFETDFAGESIDYGDKSMSQCDSMANKQMLIHTFLIPTKDMEEPDNKEEHQIRSIHEASSAIPNRSELNTNNLRVRAGGYIIQGGKFANQMVSSIDAKEALDWVNYVKSQNKNLKKDTSAAILAIETFHS